MRVGRAGVVVLLGLIGVTGMLRPYESIAREGDAVQRKVRRELRSFTDWLEANHARGYIGEVGWPARNSSDDGRWNRVAEAWYDDADAAGLWVTAWSTGEWWGTNYPLAIYEDRARGRAVDSPNPQAVVVERHNRRRGYRRGVNVAGGEFGTPVIQPTSEFSNANPGMYDRDYHYDSRNTFDFLASRGIKLVRIPFRWERLQRSPGGRLKADELERIKDVARRARRAGLRIVLDMHNYSGYYLDNGDEGVRRAIGSEQVTIGDFADVWRRIARTFKEVRAVRGFGLMNEPVELPATGERSAAESWEVASRRAVRAIRRAGVTKVVFVPGYMWAGVQTWQRQHPDAWISRRLGPIRYEAHHYWDCDHSGRYERSYDEEQECAEGQGWPAIWLVRELRSLAPGRP
ncbi:MAG: glycoside hydrolase family 5 protein [Actinomycetota bacterium]